MVIATAYKKSKDKSIGLWINTTTLGELVISHVDNDGLFATSALRAGMKIQSINDKETKGMTLEDAKQLIKSIEGEIKIQTYTTDEQSVAVFKPSKNDRCGIGFVNCKTTGKLLVGYINPNGLFSDGKLKIGMKINSINGKCMDGVKSETAAKLIRELKGRIEVFFEVPKDEEDVRRIFIDNTFPKVDEFGDINTIIPNEASAKKCSTSPTKKNDDDETAVKIITVNPGKLGLAVSFTDAKEDWGGCVIKVIRPTCAFGDKINIGEHIVSINESLITCQDDLAIGSHLVRKMGVMYKVSKERPETSIPGETPQKKSPPKRSSSNDKKRKAYYDAIGEMSERKKDQVKRAKSDPRYAALQKQLNHAEFVYRCHQLALYKYEHLGDCNSVPIDYRSSTDLTFGEWVKEQRRLYKDGKLDNDQVQHLQLAGFDFNYIQPAADENGDDEQWNNKFNELVQYQKKYGDGDVPITYPYGQTLGIWAHQQRQLYNEGKLEEKRHKKLDDKKFIFEPGTNVKSTLIDKAWQDNYDKLVQFKTDHGHLDVPVDYKPNSLSAYLDRWVGKQRSEYRRQALSKPKIRMLKEIGFELDGRKKVDESGNEERWNSMFNQLLAYRQEHGNCLVPTASGKLGGWVRVQRKKHNKQTLSDERKQRLLDAGFDFNPKNRQSGGLTEDQEEEVSSIFTSTAWKKNYEALKLFIESNGNADIPPNFKGDHIEGDLSTWLETQKTFFEQGSLPSKQIEMLVGLGVNLR